MVEPAPELFIICPSAGVGEGEFEVSLVWDIVEEIAFELDASVDVVVVAI
jgi:hypothetical protein